ncbi:precorrin-3B synthase [Methylobacterium sp. PvR107]|uniref:precorrin-3B synthase n=1 Tax=Methylobacterium sp. PvR107 TaxID=2806597 RepID=UPI001AEA94DB|nr:precorrin-3B synthase [Methylobacterium sp. PvR107]MBP1182584.1 precorrin-3B synthase [Methylobacterium sp. PvR107]
MSAPARQHRRALPEASSRRGWCPGLARPMPTGDGLLARVHPPLGVLTCDQARAVAEGARRFGNGHMDFTARANLQIRGVSDTTRRPLARLLETAGLGDVRTDGGPQRLTLTSPLAGCDSTERLDVPVLAHAIEAAGRAIPGLPAKTLVVVEGRPDVTLPDADCFVAASVADTVVIAAATTEGRRDFVTCGEHEAPPLVAALLAAFARTGHRRMRDLSDEELEALVETLHALRQAKDPPLKADRRRGSNTRDGKPFAPNAGLRTIAGHHVIAIDAPFGRCSAASLDRVVRMADVIGADAIRLSPTRGFVLRAAPGTDAAPLLAALADAFIVTPDDPRRGIDACTGAPGCASGSTPTLVDAARLADALRSLEMPPLAVHVSGCAKGCARPAPADLTLVGRAGLYGAIIGRAPGDEPALYLPIEAVLERLGRAKTVGLAAAFAPDTDSMVCGRTRRPA